MSPTYMRLFVDYISFLNDWILIVLTFLFAKMTKLSVYTPTDGRLGGSLKKLAPLLRNTSASVAQTQLTTRLRPMQLCSVAHSQKH